MSEIGLIFVMFMAGLETNLFQKTRKGNLNKVINISLINGLVPFITGYSIAYLFGYPTLTSILLGVVFISSSIAVVIPSLTSAKLLNTKLGNTIITTTVIQDVASLIILSFVLQASADTSSVHPLILYPALVLLFFIFRKFLPLIKSIFNKEFHNDDDVFEQELRSILVLLIGIVVIFTSLGLHAILAAFFAGTVLSDIITHNRIKGQLHSIGYGIFVPIFFITVGLETDMSVLFTSDLTIIVLALSVVFGSGLSKYISGYFASRFNGFSKPQSKMIAVSTIPQLSTTLAVAFTGVKLGIISTEIVTALILLTIFSTLISPLLAKFAAIECENEIEKNEK
jgi:Kef-type K+ transport system membrane component KefB